MDLMSFPKENFHCSPYDPTLSLHFMFGVLDLIHS